MHSNTPIGYGQDDIGTRTLEHIESAQKYNQWISQKISPYLGKTNLELGAGTGTISNCLLGHEGSFYLTEASATCRNALRARFEKTQNISVKDDDYFTINEKVDCIYSSNVLEHIEDDLGVIKTADQLLNPGGYFVAVVPSHQILFSDFDQQIGHFRRYSGSDIKRIEQFIIRNTSLKLISSRTFNPVGAVGWFVKMRLLKQKQVQATDLKLMEYLIPFLKVLDLVNLGFGQSRVLVIQKS
jgi:SAM-dependent methyltransferase